jgi:hypothetical protein
VDSTPAKTDHASRHRHNVAVRKCVRDPRQHRVVRRLPGGRGNDGAVGDVEIDGGHPDAPATDLGVTEVGHLQDLYRATGRIARSLEHLPIRFEAIPVRIRSVFDRLQEYGARADEGADPIDVAIGQRILGEAKRQPDDRLDAQGLLQRLLDPLP